MYFLNTLFSKAQLFFSFFRSLPVTFHNMLLYSLLLICFITYYSSAMLLYRYLLILLLGVFSNSVG